MELTGDKHRAAMDILTLMRYRQASLVVGQSEGGFLQDTEIVVRMIFFSSSFSRIQIK